MSSGSNLGAESIDAPARRFSALDRIEFRSYGIVLSFLALFIALSLATDKFLTQRNLLNILDQSAPVGIATFLGAKYTVWVFALFAIATSFLLSRTTLGRYFYAVGGNAEAASLSGIRVEQVRTLAFVISGLSAGIAGVLAASRTSSAQPDFGMELALQAIAAAVVGGTSIMGGQGAIWRAVLGVLILAMIGNGFNLLGIDTIYQQIVQGLLIMLAVGLDQLLRRRR